MSDSENLKPLIDGLAAAHLADTFKAAVPPAPGPANSLDIARIAAISNDANGAK